MQKHFDEEFKRELITSRKPVRPKELAREAGVHLSTIYRWMDTYCTCDKHALKRALRRIAELEEKIRQLEKAK